MYQTVLVSLFYPPSEVNSIKNTGLDKIFNYALSQRGLCLPSGLDVHLLELIGGFTDGAPALSDLDIPPPHFLPQKIHIGSHFTVPIAIPP